MIQTDRTPITRPAADRTQAGNRATVIAFVAATIAAVLVLGGICMGSGNFSRFDTPLAAYAAATVFAAFAMVYRYAMWVQRPPTWLYFKSSWKLFLRPRALVRNIFKLIKLLFDNIVLQRFIEHRSKGRWVAHMCLAWGCLIAFAITVPLSWGWVQFGHDNGYYIVEVMGRRQFAFPPHSILGFLIFNGLNISAVFVLIGVAAAMHRRVFDHGAQAVQSLAADLVPLFLLFAVAVTGLMLMASYRLMGGQNFAFLSLLHAFTVVILLLYMPFGKLFHVIQRPAQLGVAYYKEEGAKGPKAVCPISGQEFQSQMHHDDLVTVMKELGFDFGEHQDISPEEKRKLVAINQAAVLGDKPYAG